MELEKSSKSRRSRAIFGEASGKKVREIKTHIIWNTMLTSEFTDEERNLQLPIPAGHRLATSAAVVSMLITMYQSFLAFPQCFEDHVMEKGVSLLKGYTAEDWFPSYVLLSMATRFFSRHTGKDTTRATKGPRKLAAVIPIENWNLKSNHCATIQKDLAIFRTTPMGVLISRRTLGTVQGTLTTQYTFGNE